MNWKSILACAASALVAVSVAAFGQTILRSVQLSQDTTGGFGVDASYNFYLTKGNHLLTFGTPAAPVLSGCGTTPSITGSDFSFKLTTGSAATTCTITFAAAFLTAPQCFLQANGGATQPTFTTSTTALTVTVDIASTVYSGLCVSVS